MLVRQAWALLLTLLTACNQCLVGQTTATGAQLSAAAAASFSEAKSSESMKKDRPSTADRVVIYSGSSTAGSLSQQPAGGSAVFNSYFTALQDQPKLAAPLAAIRPSPVYVQERTINEAAKPATGPAAGSSPAQARQGLAQPDFTTSTNSRPEGFVPANGRRSPPVAVASVTQPRAATSRLSSPPAGESSQPLLRRGHPALSSQPDPAASNFRTGSRAQPRSDPLDEYNFPQKDAEIDKTSWNAASMLLDPMVKHTHQLLTAYALIILSQIAVPYYFTQLPLFANSLQGLISNATISASPV